MTAPIDSVGGATAVTPPGPAPAPDGTGFSLALRQALAVSSPIGTAAGASSTVASSAASASASAAPVTLGQMLHAWSGASTQVAPTLAAVSPAAGAVSDLYAAAHRAEPAVAPPVGAGRVRPVAGEVGSGFGPRVHPVHGGVRDHAGVDVGAPTGTPIHAATAGTVVFAGERGGYGNLVILDHGGGVTTRYAHASALDVAAGQVVEAGDVIARVGSTGVSTGPHLHFEVRHDGVAVDPQAHGWW